MITRFCAIASLCLMAMLLGCSQDESPGEGTVDSGQARWTKVGQVKVSYERDQDIVRASHLAGTYSSIRFETNGPARIHRIAITYDDGSSFLPEKGLTFEKEGSQVLQLPGGQRKLDQVAMSYSGGRLFRGTTVTLWAR